MKHFLKKIFKYFDYKISRNNNFSNVSSIDILSNVFDRKDDITIFDVGAHVGQSTKTIANYLKIPTYMPLNLHLKLLKF